MSREFVLKQLPKSSVGMEIGVWMGEFSEKINKIIQPSTLYLVDPWEFSINHPDRWYGGRIAKNQSDMDTIYNDVVDKFSKFNNISILRIYSSNLLQCVETNTLDWVYIDGDHSYDKVLNDLNISNKLVKHNGIIAGDDYTNGNDIHRAVIKFLNSNHSYNLQIKGRQFIIKKA